jgi:DNA-binding CsgD family transcriptional regulator
MTDRGLLPGDGGAYASEFLVASQLMGYGRFAAADEVLARATDLATRDEEVAVGAAVRASNRFWRLADRDGAHAVLAAAARRVRDPAAVDGILAQRALLLLFEGNTARAEALSRRVRRRERTYPAGIVMAAGVEALAAGLRGADEAGDGAGDGLVAIQLGVLHLSAGLARAINGREAADGDAPHRARREAMAAACEGTADVVHATNQLWAGRPRSAAATLERAIGHLRRSDRFHTGAVAFGQLAYAHALRGEAGEAASAAAAASAHHHPVSRFATFFVGRGEAWAAAARGELSVAHERLVTTAEDCERWGQPALAAQAWHDLARLGAPRRALAPLARLARPAASARSSSGGRPGLVAELSAHVAALAEGDAAAVAGFATQARQRGHHLHAAEAAAQAAALFGPRRRAAADRGAVTARALLDQCEGARTPALARLHQLDLTLREREIIGLAASGLRNRDIADRLDLSVRTVENHLQSGYGKLGVHRRADLAGLHWLGPDADVDAAALGTGAPEAPVPM